MLQVFRRDIIGKLLTIFLPGLQQQLILHLKLELKPRKTESLSLAIISIVTFFLPLILQNLSVSMICSGSWCSHVYHHTLSMKEKHVSMVDMTLAPGVLIVMVGGRPRWNWTLLKQLACD